MLLRWQARRRRDERFDNAKRYREEFGWEDAPQSEPMRRMRERFGNYLEVVACGRPFIVDLRDTVVGPGILYYGVWEPEKSELFKRLLKSGDRVVDIGANIGYFSVIFAAAVGVAGQVLAIEPDPDNVRLLRENLRMNGLAARTSVVRAAAGPRADWLYLYAKAGVTNRGDHRTFGDGIMGARRRRVRMVAVDECVRDWPSVQTIKMDIQGYECFALQGMQRTLERNADIALVAEFWPSEMRRAGSDPHDFLSGLSRLGFSAWRISGASKLAPLESETLVSELEPEGASADLVFMRARFASQRLGGLL
jgi:FkbM family methyltransferase